MDSPGFYSARHFRLHSVEILQLPCPRITVPLGGYLFVYALQSPFEAIIEEKRYVIPRRHMLLIASDVDYTFNGNGAMLFTMLFSPCAPDRAHVDIGRCITMYPHTEQLFCKIYPYLRINDAEYSFSLLFTILHAFQGRMRARDYMLRSYLDVLFIKISRSLWLHNSSGKVAYVAAAKTYIREHYSENINVGSVAAHVGVSKSYLQALFSRYQRHTILEYINRGRVDDAALLLCCTQHSIDEISQMCGYASRQHFTSTFNRIHGITPREYRKLFSKQPAMLTPQKPPK